MNANADRLRIVLLQIVAIALLLAAVTALFTIPAVIAQESNPPQTPAATPAPATEPAPEPTPAPTTDPTPEPTPAPTTEPSPEPTPAPTTDPTPEPTPAPTTDPTPEPTPAPATDPTPEPTPAPATDPTPEPTPAPTTEPAPEPTPAPTTEPAPEPTPAPTTEPAPEPTPAPATEPAPEPTPAPTTEPTPEPTPAPTTEPTPEPTPAPTTEPAPEPKKEPRSNPVQRGARGAQEDATKKPRNVTVTRKAYSAETSPGLFVDWDAPQDTSTFTTYTIEYRKSSASGWTHFSGSKDNTNLSATIEGLDPGTQYQVRIRGSGGQNGPWSDAVSATSNRKPSFTGNFVFINAEVPVGVTNSSDVAQYFEDDDGDSLTYSVSVQYPGFMQAQLEGSTLSHVMLNPGVRSTLTFSASDAYGGVVTSGKLNIMGTADWTRNVTENSPAGTVVGTRWRERPTTARR